MKNILKLIGLLIKVPMWAIEDLYDDIEDIVDNYMMVQGILTFMLLFFTEYADVFLNNPQTHLLTIFIIVRMASIILMTLCGVLWIDNGSRILGYIKSFFYRISSIEIAIIAVFCKSIRYVYVRLAT